MPFKRLVLLSRLAIFGIFLTSGATINAPVAQAQVPCDCGEEGSHQAWLSTLPLFNPVIHRNLQPRYFSWDDYNEGTAQNPVSVSYVGPNTFQLGGSLLMQTLDVGDRADEVVVRGRLLAVGLRHDGVALYDLVDPSRPVYLGSAPVPRNRKVEKIALHGQRMHVLVSHGNQQEVLIFEVSDPETPLALGQYDASQAAATFGIVKGGYLLARGADGFIVYRADAQP